MSDEKPWKNTEEFVEWAIADATRNSEHMEPSKVPLCEAEKLPNTLVEEAEATTCPWHPYFRYEGGVSDLKVTLSQVVDILHPGETVIIRYEVRESLRAGEMKNLVGAVRSVPSKALAANGMVIELWLVMDEQQWKTRDDLVSYLVGPGMAVETVSDEGLKRSGMHVKVLFVADGGTKSRPPGGGTARRERFDS